MNKDKTSLENESQPSCLGAVSGWAGFQGTIFKQLKYKNNVKKKLQRSS